MSPSSSPSPTAYPNHEAPQVAVIMGSVSDWSTMGEAAAVLREFDIPHACHIVSAHRTPDWMVEFAQSAQAKGIQVIIAGAGGAAHLPGMVASLTPLPVLGVPVESKTLKGMDSLLSIVQMPGGVPVGTMAIGTAGAKNAGLMAVRVLGLQDDALQQRMVDWMKARRDQVMETVLPWEA